MLRTAFTAALLLCCVPMLAASSDKPRIVYKLQSTCDPVVLQTATGLEQTDLLVTPHNIWEYLSSSLASQGNGWFAPHVGFLPRVLRPHMHAVLRVSYSVYSRVVVLELSTQDVADSALSRLQEWGTSAGRCVLSASGDHSLLSLQSTTDAQQGSRDPRLRDQWGLFAIDVMNDHGQHVEGAWASTTGEPQVAVAVVDTGIDFTHPDLKDNAWKNTGDSNQDGVDEDGNGFVDDVMGFNFVEDNANVSDANGHGTHMAGVIGAQGDNGVGVVGVSMSVRLMALKAFNVEGTARMSDVVRALDYAAFMGAHAVLLPATGGGAADTDRDNFAPLKEAIDALSAEGIVVVVAAGNDRVDLQQHPRYPASWSTDSMIVVAASSGNEAIAPFSSFGPRQVHLVAPGRGVVTTTPGGGVGAVNGTSVAAAFVTGVAALLLSDLAQNSLPCRGYGHWVQQVITSSVDYHQQYVGLVSSGGRLNAGKALALQQQVLGLPRPADRQADSKADREWTVGADTQASPVAARLDKIMMVQQGAGPVMRVDVPLTKQAASSLRDTNQPFPRAELKSSTRRSEDVAHTAKTKTKSHFSWLWDSIKDARVGGVMHACDDLDCGA